MPDEFIAIAGPLAVGKSTLIDRLLDDRDLQERFEIQGKVALWSPIHNKHNVPIDIAGDDCDVVLWEWQRWNRYYVYGFKIDWPSRKHRAIVVWRPPQTVVDDHQMTRGSCPTMPENSLQVLRGRWWGFYRKFGPDSHLQAMGIRVELVDGSNNYDPIDWEVVLNGTS